MQRTGEGPRVLGPPRFAVPRNTCQFSFIWEHFSRNRKNNQPALQLQDFPILNSSFGSIKSSFCIQFLFSFVIDLSSVWVICNFLSMATSASETLLRRQLRVHLTNLISILLIYRKFKRSLNHGTLPASSMIPTSMNGKSQSSGNLLLCPPTSPFRSFRIFIFPVLGLILICIVRRTRYTKEVFSKCI